jgi:hypothetical protein
VPPPERSRPKQEVAPTTWTWSSSLVHDVHRRLFFVVLCLKDSTTNGTQQAAAFRAGL